MIAVTWLFSIAQGILPLVGFGEIKYSYSFAACILNIYNDSPLIRNIYYAVLLVALSLIPLTVIVICNIWTACIARKHIMKVYRMRRTIKHKEEWKKYNQDILKTRNKKQLALMRGFGGILVGNLIVWMPCILFVMISLVVDDNLIPVGIYTFVYVTFIMHTVVHPLVEGCFIPEIRETAMGMFGVSACKKRFENKGKGTVSDLQNLQFQTSASTLNN
jgi:hypothetical protein